MTKFKIFISKTTIFLVALGSASCSTPKPVLSSVERCTASEGQGASCARDATGRDAQIRQFRQIIRSLTYPKGPTWESTVEPKLRNAPPESIERVEQILDMLLVKNGPMQKDLEPVFARLKPPSTAFWDAYLSVYDKMMPFSDGYVQIAAVADQFLQADAGGKIVEYGMGTGNIAGLLLLMDSRREIEGMDFSPEGIAIAKQKFAAIVAALREGDVAIEPRIKAEAKTIQESSYPANSVGNAVMSNVLYQIPPAERLKILMKIYEELRPCGRLILNDPVKAIIQKNPAKLRKFVGDVARSAFTNDAPLTEFDWAFIAALNFQHLMKDNPFLDVEETLDLGRQAGFEVDPKLVIETYNGGSRTYIFKKVCE